MIKYYYDLEEIILFAEKIICKRNVSIFDRFYPFSTENLTYMKNFNFSGKSFLLWEVLVIRFLMLTC